MNFQKDFVKKICSFYAGDCHLATMMLPYLSKQIQKDVKIETILDKDMSNYIEELLSKINIEEEIKQKVKNINWKQRQIEGEEVQNFIKGKLTKNKEYIFIINTNQNEILNEKVDRFMTENFNYIVTNNIKINIIDCYEITKFNHINEILDKHDMILNTSGLHQIEEVFEDYVKKDNLLNENKFVG